MALYRVNDDGRAPSGLGVGDEVVTAGGTYRIDSVGADGQYKSTLVNKGQTTQSYKGSYATRNTLPGYSDYTAGIPEQAVNWDFARGLSDAKVVKNVI